MMKKIIFRGMLIYLFHIVNGCSDMNDVHDIYLQDGEILYVGRVDSARVLAGDERFILRYWITDSRVNELKIYWSQKQDSLIIPVPSHEPLDSMDVLIGDEHKIIPEGSHTVRLISTDGGNLRSIVYEKTGNVYGPKFAATISDRLIRQVKYNAVNSELTIDWADITSPKEAGIELSYFTTDNTPVTIKLSTEQVGTKTILNNVSKSRDVTYRTMFLPEPLAIDTFYAETIPVEITRVVNVALNKAVRTSDKLNDNYTGVNAVDGVISDPSRWVSTASGEHWIEIDLGQEYTIDSFETWNGSGGQVNTPIPAFKFQAEVNDEWQDLAAVTGNALADFKTTFGEVTTGKVRFVTDTQTRLFEIAVYSTIRY